MQWFPSSVPWLALILYHTKSFQLETKRGRRGKLCGICRWNMISQKWGNIISLKMERKQQSNAFSEPERNVKMKWKKFNSITSENKKIVNSTTPTNLISHDPSVYLQHQTHAGGCSSEWVSHGASIPRPHKCQSFRSLPPLCLTLLAPPTIFCPPPHHTTPTSFAPPCSCPSASPSSYDASPWALGKPSPLYWKYSRSVLLACTPVPQQCLSHPSLLPHLAPVSAVPHPSRQNHFFCHSAESSALLVGSDAPQEGFRLFLSHWVWVGEHCTV